MILHTKFSVKDTIYVVDLSKKTLKTIHIKSICTSSYIGMDQQVHTQETYTNDIGDTYVTGGMVTGYPVYLNKETAKRILLKHL